jgi:hypothetical protein
LTRKIPIVELPRFGAVVTIAATLCALASDCTSTGHVWITVWRRHGLNPFRIFSLPIDINGVWAGDWGVAARVSRHVPWNRNAIRAYCTVHPQALYTAALPGVVDVRER